jgi:alkylhydroperoxidase/carboxymuconolactone decarboxylase family protein YurZ
MSEPPLSNYKGIDMEAVTKVDQMRAFALANGVLPKKVKILIALALDAAHGAVQGVKSLAQQAKLAGASKEEIAETLRVALYVNGASCIYTAAAALRELDL